MKFLFLSCGAHLALDPSSSRVAGGAELQVALLARELVGRGHEAVLLGADTGQPDGVFWEGIRVRNGGSFETGGVIDTMRAWPRIHRILSEERPDAVVIYGWTTLLYALAWWRWIIPFRLVFVCALDAEIDGDFRRSNPLRGFLFERGMRCADHRFSITSEQASLFQGKGMDCTVTRLLIQGRPAPVLARKSVDLLWVARCDAVKRPELFLELALRFPNSVCRMICSPHDLKLWERIREQAGRVSNVEFLEIVPYREIQSHFDAAKIFVNTSSHEGVPNTFIHSGLGRTAIASLEIDPDAMFSHFAAGICAQGDIELLTEGIGKLLANDSVLSTAGEESARFVSEWHDNARNTEIFLGAVKR
jgi:glycosyltransferase involved in cell wall biosynthesis